MPKSAKICSTVLALTLLKARNTVQGAGEDIEAAGDGIQRTSAEVGSSV